MNPPALAAHGLTKRFGDFTAVENVSFTLGPGELLAYVAPTGSGKTTTMRMVLGLVRPTVGRAELFGQEVARAGDAIRQQVGYMSQRAALYDELTVRENLSFYAMAYGVRDSARIGEVLRQFDLEAVADTPAGALLHRPRLLTLDEPTSGVAPVSRRSFWDRIYALAAQGVAALVTTHYLEEAEYCHRVGIMIRGSLLALDEPARLKRSTLPGAAWDIFAEPVLEALQELESDPSVVRAGLAGDHLRAITRAGAGTDELQARLRARGFRDVRQEAVEPSLEEGFLALAGREGPG